MGASINESWGGRPQQPDYPQPNIPATTFTGGDIVQRADARIRYAGRKFNEHRGDIETHRAARHFGDDYAQAVTQNFANTECAKDAEQAVAEVQAWRHEAAEAVKAEREKFTTPSDTASQIAAQRSWERSRRQLESARNAGQVAATARNLVANASGAELVTLAEELRPWLDAAGQPSGWIDDAITAAAPEYKAAKDELAERDRKLLKVQHNARVTREGYKGAGANPRTLIPPT
jgi:hypothetical protein